MARSQVKAGGPTRGRRRPKKLGMGSGKIIAAARVRKMAVPDKKPGK